MSISAVVPRVGIVVPTLGTRPDYLVQCVDSIRRATKDDVFILLVAPSGFVLPENLKVDHVVEDPGHGLASAINYGEAMLPSSVEFFNWLGDDDLLAEGSIDRTVAELTIGSAPFAFGQCDYIDPEGCLLFTNRSGRWAVPLMRFGPQLIPQPGAMFRRKAFQSVGRLDVQYKWAFDLDIFIRLSLVARPTFIPSALASFRWHDDSLSVGGRQGSVNEASLIRIRHLHPILKRLSFLWEPFMRQLILRVGQRIKTSSS